MRTNKRPAHICQDLHVAFAELGIAWKHCGPYNYKCRATVRSRSRDKSVVSQLPLLTVSPFLQCVECSLQYSD